MHVTRLEVDLNSIRHNLGWYRSRLIEGTKTMAMVKASAYGSGSGEVAKLLEYNRVDYFGVAYPDEGVALRKQGISLPILVLNPPPHSLNQLLRYDLEAEIYSMEQATAIHDQLKLTGGHLKSHIKIDTGMHRLGFGETDLNQLCDLLRENPHFEVTGIMSHLAGADDPNFKDFTLTQLNLFEKSADFLIRNLDINPLRHVLNSAGIINYPEFQFEMVRLGIGLYGYDSSERYQSELQPAGTLYTTISQIRELNSGESVGYSRAGQISKESRIATIAIGYSDGFPRSLGNGVGEVLINNQPAKVIGNICMDMAMVDLTGIDAKVGDDVIIFGRNHPIESFAEKQNTIPYEVLTNIGERVKRVFVYN